jgi:hypothetical protein
MPQTNHRSLRSRNRVTPPVAQTPPEGIYAKIASLAQVFMLVLVAFGYWYTVLPVYQKSLLDEDIAKKTIELNKATKDLGSLHNDLENLRAKVTLKEVELSALQKSIEGYKRESLNARVDASNAKQESIVARDNAATKYALLRSQSLSLFWGELLRYCVGSSVATDAKLAECVETQSRRSAAFGKLDEPDGRSVIEAIRVSISKNKDVWNKVFQDYAEERKLLEGKLAQVKQSYETEKAKRKVSTQQERIDAIAADYDGKNAISDAKFSIIKLEIKFPSQHEKILRLILNIPV